MRERRLLLEVNRATLTVRSLSASLTADHNAEAVFEHVKKSLKHWSKWTKHKVICQHEHFLSLVTELKKIHAWRRDTDQMYKQKHDHSFRCKKRIICEAIKLRGEQDLARKTYGLMSLKKRWRETDTVFQPIEYLLWCEFQEALQPVQYTVSQRRDQVEEIRIRSAQLRHEFLQESKTLEQTLSEAEATLAIRQLISKWKEIPRVDPYQEQRFWRWTEKSLGVILRKSG